MATDDDDTIPAPKFEVRPETIQRLRYAVRVQAATLHQVETFRADDIALIAEERRKLNAAYEALFCGVFGETT